MVMVLFYHEHIDFRSNLCKEINVGLRSYIDKLISKWKDDKYSSIRKRIMMEIEQENDPQKKIEKMVLLKIRGTLLGGMASSSAYVSFKQEHFEILEDISTQDSIKSALLRILRSNEYMLQDKMRVAYVCADIVLVEAIPEIEKLACYSTSDNIVEQQLAKSLQALKSGKSITELIYDELRRKGDL